MESEPDLDELAEDLLRVLARLALNQRRGSASSVASGNLTLGQLSILFALLAEGPIHMNELAAHERVRNPTATVAIRRLEKLGLGRLPGDVRFRCFGRRWSLPFGSSLVIALLGLVVARLL